MHIAWPPAVAAFLVEPIVPFLAINSNHHPHQHDDLSNVVTTGLGLGRRQSRSSSTPPAPWPQPAGKSSPLPPVAPPGAGPLLNAWARSRRRTAPDGTAAWSRSELPQQRRAFVPVPTRQGDRRAGPDFCQGKRPWRQSPGMGRNDYAQPWGVVTAVAGLPRTQATPLQFALDDDDSLFGGGLRGRWRS